MKKPTKCTIIKTICIAVPVAAVVTAAALIPKIAKTVRRKKYTTSY